MNRARWWNPRLGPISFCGALLVIHALLKFILARYDVVSSMFAAGPHVPRWMIVCAGAFVTVRLAVFLLVPALLTWRLVMAIARHAAAIRHGDKT